MASYTDTEFGTALTQWVNGWDRSTLNDAISAWYDAQQVLRQARAERAADLAAWNASKPDFASARAELLSALAAAESAFEKPAGTVAALNQAFLRFSDGTGGDATCLDTLHAAVAQLADAVAALLPGYERRIAPGAAFQPLVEAAVFPRFLALARRVRSTYKAGGLDPATADAAEAQLYEELTASFAAAMASYTPNPYERPAATRARTLIDGLHQAEADAAEARDAVMQASAALLQGVLDFLRNNTCSANRARMREMLRIRVIQPARVIPIEVKDEREAPAAGSAEARGLDTDSRTLLNAIEGQWRDAIDATLNDSGSPALPAPAPAPRQAHVCGAACLTQDGTCQRRTADDGYCYQHAPEVPDQAAQALAGRWTLVGVQGAFEHSGWEADLTLAKNGTATWKEVRGANPGARRSGRWNLRNGVFTLHYRAPHSGQVEWLARGVLPAARSMSGDYRTPQISSQGVGYGGTFSGEKRSR